ncbi:MAG TPA: M48 family metalloprotease [Candidatus Limnocylindrales bacterium]|nr:M48 family metalloprotease [Candidatus Limnocylindrales bacterium]
MRRLLAIVLAINLAAPPALVGRALASVAEEKKLAAEFMAQAMPHLPLIHDYEVVSFVRSMGNKMVKTLGPQPFDFEFFVIRENSINAFAVPGGKVFVHAGLIARAESEDELAGVMGHEIGHAHAHHMVRQQQKGAAAGYASLLGIFLGIINPVLAAGALAAGQAAQLKYQRDFEREADFLGIEYARKAGYEPIALTHLLRKIYTEQQLNPTLIPPYFQSHPLSGERLSNLEAVLGKKEYSAERLQPTLRLKRAQAIARGYAQTREEAIPDYERALAQATPQQRPEALELIGVLMTAGEDWGLAEKYLREAEAAGRNVDREMGRVALRSGRLDEARTRLERAHKKDPADWDVLAELGTIDYQEGRMKQAVERLQASVDAESYRPDVLQTLARALGKTGKEGAGFYWFARTAEIQGQLPQAMVYYRRAMDALPADDPLREKIVKRGKELGDEIREEREERRREGTLEPGIPPPSRRLPGPGGR